MDVVEKKLGKIPDGPTRNAETRVRTSKRAAFLNLLYRVAVIGAVVHLAALAFGWLWGTRIWWSIEDALFETPLSRTDNTPGLAKLFLWWVGMPWFLGLPVLIAALDFLSFALKGFFDHLGMWTSRFLDAGSAATGKGKPRHVVVCLDGTWNRPEFDPKAPPHNSNVFELWLKLRGTKPRWFSTVAADAVKVDDAEECMQIALYYRGIGNADEHTRLGAMLEGAFGFGAARIRRRAYVDILRYVRPQDHLTIVGFSRGAATARWLANLIAKAGIPEPRRLWRPLPTTPLLGRLFKVQRREHDIDVLACFDTVAAFGIARDAFGIPFQRMNLGKELGIPACVKRAFHMVAIDDQRDAFHPTLMDPDQDDRERITEVWFAGVHAQVGGGYPDDPLSDITFEYLVDKLAKHFDREAHALTFHDGAPQTTPQVDRWNRSALAPIADNWSPAYAVVPRPMPLTACIHGTAMYRWLHKAGYAPPNLSRLVDQLESDRVARKRVAEHLAGIVGEAGVRAVAEHASQEIDARFGLCVDWPDQPARRQRFAAPDPGSVDRSDQDHAS
ncbi:MAG: DUF2235 domain-containing protein [Planctomycetota bacterium]